MPGDPYEELRRRLAQMILEANRLREDAEALGQPVVARTMTTILAMLPDPEDITKPAPTKPKTALAA